MLLNCKYNNDQTIRQFTIFFYSFLNLYPHPHSLRITECLLLSQSGKTKNVKNQNFLSTSLVQQRCRPVQFHLEETFLSNILTDKITYCSFLEKVFQVFEEVCIAEVYLCILYNTHISNYSLYL